MPRSAAARPENPFFPVFGGKPEVFFGRRDVIERFRGALRGTASPAFRTLFLTGTRGMGKTSLLERLSGEGEAAGWEPVELGVDDPVFTLTRTLALWDETSVERKPELGFGLLGVEASVGGMGSAHVRRTLRSDLSRLLEQATVGDGRRLLILIDEAQKLSLDDAALLSTAFQRSSRKGGSLALVFAGLPRSYERIIQHDGCTFLRRMHAEEVGLLSPGEVRNGLAETFGGLGDLCLGEGALDLLVKTSKGQPYLVQLLGAFAVDLAKPDGNSFRVDADVAEAAAKTAIEEYGRQALEPMLDEIAPKARRYLRALGQVADGRSVAEGGQAAALMGEAPGALSKYAGELVDLGWIVRGRRRGTFVFAIPYLDRWVRREDEASPIERTLASWGIGDYDLADGS